MYQVYLVDDEPIFLSSFLAMPEWLDNQFEIIGHSTSARTALEEIPRLCPHVLFTDIRMPHINGLELIERLHQGMEQPPLPVITSAYSDFCYLKKSLQLSVFDYLLKPVDKQDFETLLGRIQSHLARNTLVQPYEAYHDRFRTVLEYIDAHLPEKLTLSDVAEQTELSSNTVGGYFSRYMNTTFSAYITEKRMEKACLYLEKSQKQVKEIASLCGYPDYFYFCRVFQQQHSCTPSEWRKKEQTS